MEKDIQNANAVACKLGSALIKVINYRLKVVRKEQRKIKEIVERQKTEIMAAKCQRARGGISSSNKDKKNYESDIGDETDPN